MSSEIERVPRATDGGRGDYRKLIITDILNLGQEQEQLWNELKRIKFNVLCLVHVLGRHDHPPDKDQFVELGRAS